MKITICGICSTIFDAEWSAIVCPHQPEKTAKAPFHPKLNPSGYCMEHGQQACKVKHLADTLELEIF